MGCLVWSAAGVSAVSLSPHDHSRHAHDDDPITNLSTSSHDHSTHHHSDAGAMTRTASLSSADDNEWTTLYETFPNDNNPPRHNEDQRLMNDVQIATTTGTLGTLVINIGTPTRTPIPRASLVEAYSQASTRVTLMYHGMAMVAVEYFGRDVSVPDVGDVCNNYFEILNAARAIVATELSLDVYRSVDYVIPTLLRLPVDVLPSRCSELRGSRQVLERPPASTVANYGAVADRADHCAAADSHCAAADSRGAV